MLHVFLAKTDETSLQETEMCKEMAMQGRNPDKHTLHADLSKHWTEGKK